MQLLFAVVHCSHLLGLLHLLAFPASVPSAALAIIQQKAHDIVDDVMEEAKGRSIVEFPCASPCMTDPA